MRLKMVCRTVTMIVSLETQMWGVKGWKSEIKLQKNARGYGQSGDVFCVLACSPWAVNIQLSLGLYRLCWTLTGLKRHRSDQIRSSVSIINTTVSLFSPVLEMRSCPCDCKCSVVFLCLPQMSQTISRTLTQVPFSVLYNFIPSTPLHLYDSYSC